MKKVIIIGSGWAGSSFLKYLDTDKYDVTVISNCKKFIYTPLLANSIFHDKDLEYDLISEKKIKFIEGNINNINFKNNEIEFNEKMIDYDYLILAHGSNINTFNIEGVQKYCFFLKNSNDVIKIQNKLNSLNKNSKIAVIGCGPTGSEIIGNLIDKDKFKIFAIDGLKMPLSVYNKDLSSHTYNLWKKYNVNLYFDNFVKKIDENKIYFKDTDITYDMVFWCGGVKISELSQNINKKLGLNCKFGIPVDKYLKVKNTDNVYAIGDCSYNDLPPTAQVSYQEGKYLAKKFNNNFKNSKKFIFYNKGQICYIGKNESVYQSKYFSSGGKIVGYLNNFIHIYNAINLNQSLDFLKNLFK